MSQQTLASSLNQKKGFYSNSTLVLGAFSSTFFSRIFCSITHAPSVLNHLHFATVPFVLGTVLSTTRVRDRKQIAIAQMLLLGLGILFGVMVASALLNSAGLINAVFDFLVLGEPFMVILAIVCLPMTPQLFERFRGWIVGSSFSNMILAFIQWPLLKTGHIHAGGLDATDGTAGVFFVSGAGNYVSTTISLYFGIYYLMFARAAPFWMRIATLFGALIQFQLTDAKQVLLAFLIGWLLLILTDIKDLGKTLTYLIAIALFIAILYWCVYNVEAFAAFKNYADKENAYGPDGVATQIKTAPFRIIPQYYTSPLNWLLGLGPGHTVGRLGGWLLKENWNILGPLGATIHPVSGIMWTAVYGNWIAMESTMFSPFFGWAGIWGDLGFLGLGVYLYLSFLVWQYLCVDGFSKFLLLSVAGFGFIFSQMEEPGFMIFTAVLVGLRWHEHRLKT